jgi:predicted ester cyclase
MGLIKAFPDIKLEFKNMFRMGDQAASQWVMTGTNTGSMAMRNMPEMPPSNKKFSIKGAGFIQLQNEKIVMETEYYNALDFMMQLGMMPNMMQGSMEGNSSGSAVKMTQGSDEARTPG